MNLEQTAVKNNLNRNALFEAIICRDSKNCISSIIQFSGVSKKMAEKAFNFVKNNQLKTTDFPESF